MSRKTRGILGGATCLLLFACSSRHQIAVAPVEVKPIHITIDVNVKVDRALDRYFEDVDAAREKISPKAPVR